MKLQERAKAIEKLLESVFPVFEKTIKQLHNYSPIISSQDPKATNILKELTEKYKKQRAYIKYHYDVLEYLLIHKDNTVSLKLRKKSV